MNRSSDRSIGDVNHQHHDSSDYYYGNVQFLSLSYIEVIPLPLFHHHDNHQNASSSPPPPLPPSLTGAFIKRQFIIDTHQSMIMSHSGCRDTSNMMVMKNPTIKVIPSNDTTDRHDQHLITGSLVMAATESSLRNNNDHDDDVFHFDNSVLWCRTNEPFGPWTEWPCHCVGYALVNHPIDRSLHTIFTTTTTSLPHASLSSRPVMVSESTLVIIRREENDTNHIRTPSDGSYGKYDMSQWKDQFTGELPTRPRSSQQKERTDTVSLLFQAQNATTIAELKFRMRQLIAEPIYVGTTPLTEDHRHRSSSTNRRGQVSRQQQIRTFQRSMNHANPPPPPPDTTPRPDPNDDHVTTTTAPSHHFGTTVLRDVALLVHSPHANDDKLALVMAMASSLDMIVHVIQPSALLAKYGIYADVALSGIVHAILIQAAVRQQTTCLIWDHWDDLQPPSSRRYHTSMGDAATPILQSMSLYIQSVLASLQNDRFIPFPRNNPLYHFNSTDRQCGMVLPVRLCWMAIMTCPDRRSEGSTDFDSNDDTHRSTFSGMGLYRLPNVTSETRYQAFRHVLTQKGMTLSQELEFKLPYLAAAAIWAHRAVIYEKCAQDIHDRIIRRRNEECIVTANTKSDPIDNFVVRLEDVQEVFQAMQLQVNGRMNGCDVQFLSNDDESTGSADRNDSFFNTTVGGNQAAKESLEDALCFDPVRRHLLHSFGITPSTGLLLYGPPGTGKTLLAKAVAKALRTQQSSSSSSAIGGAFIALNSSDIVRAEVGESEKLVVQAFHTARTNAPAVIFIDEFQALFTERSSTSSSRLTTTLLQCMDDLQRFSDVSSGNNVAINENETNAARVLVLAATNTPWMIDRAFLRSGRLDRSVLVNLPNHEERISILQLLLRKMKTSLHYDATEHQRFFLTKLSHRTDGFSGADLAALCRAAAIRCLVEQSDVVRENHFVDALDDGLRASSSSSLVKKIEQWRP